MKTNSRVTFVPTRHNLAGPRHQAIFPYSGAGPNQDALLDSLLLLHPPILEPNLHLGFVQLEDGRYLNPAGSRQILVEVELLLQLSQLFIRKVRPSRVVEQLLTHR